MVISVASPPYLAPQTIWLLTNDSLRHKRIIFLKSLFIYFPPLLMDNILAKDQGKQCLHQVSGAAGGAPHGGREVCETVGAARRTVHPLFYQM